MLLILLRKHCTLKPNNYIFDQGMECNSWVHECHTTNYYTCKPLTYNVNKNTVRLVAKFFIEKNRIHVPSEYRIIIIYSKFCKESAVAHM